MDALRSAGIAEGQLTAFFLVLARLSPLFAIGPLFGSRLVPMRARAVCAVGLAIGLTPVAGGSVRPPADVVALVLALAGEVLVGLAFAYVVSLVVAALQTAGALLDTSIGFAYGSLVDPMTGVQASVLSNLYALVGVLVFIAVGGDAWVVGGLARTFDLVPLGHMPPVEVLVQGTLTAFTGLLLAAVQVAAPVLLALVLTDAAFGVVSRAVPQLNVFAVGFPVKIAVGLVVVGASVPFVAGWLAGAVRDAVALALRASGAG
jgi:flagellar biosynthetic protein FliR